MAKNKRPAPCTIKAWLDYYRDGYKIEAANVFDGYIDDECGQRHYYNTMIIWHNDVSKTITYATLARFDRQHIDEFLTKEFGFKPIAPPVIRGIVEHKETVTQLTLF